MRESLLQRRGHAFEIFARNARYLALRAAAIFVDGFVKLRLWVAAGLAQPDLARLHRGS